MCDYRKRGVRYKDEGNYQFKNTTISEDNNRKLTPVNHLMLDVGQSESQNNLGHKYWGSDQTHSIRPNQNVHVCNLANTAAELLRKHD